MMTHKSLTEAYAEYLRTALLGRQDRQSLCAMSLEHGLPTSGSITIIQTRLADCFREQKDVEEEMEKFFAEPFAEDIEDVT